MKRWGIASVAAMCIACSPKSNPAESDAGASGDDTTLDAAAGAVLPSFMPNAEIFVSGHDVTNEDCRTGICQHNENTDMITWQGAMWLIHRTALSQILGPNSALYVYESTDGGVTFTEAARIDAPADRDIRDPHFYVVGDTLHVKALERLAVNSTRDSNVDTEAVEMHSTDGVTWSAPVDIAPHGWSFWRIKENAGVFYSAAYQDGDQSVVLYSSTDGVAWTKGATVYDVSADTPLETELTFMPSGRLLALVRMDGTQDELLGDRGRLRTKVCWATAPYATFDCSAELTGERLDGPLSFFVGSRLFVIARKHLPTGDRKRTALFEITGTLEGGPIAITEKGEFPSAGDTSYAGIAFTDATHAVASWYSGDLMRDGPWALEMFQLTDIWLGQIDFSKL